MPTVTATTAPPSTEAPRRALLPWLGTAARLLLGVVWAWAAVAKMGDPVASVRAVRAYDLLPEWLAKGVGYGLPFLEIGLAVLLIAGLATRLAAVLSSTLLVVFLVGMISAAARGLQIECGCFGGGGQLGAGQSTAYTGEILRDAGLLLVSLLLVWAYRTRFAVDNLIRSWGPQPAVRGPDRRTRKTAEARRRLAALLAERRRAGERRVRFASAATGLVLVTLVGVGIGIQAERIPARNRAVDRLRRDARGRELLRAAGSPPGWNGDPATEGEPAPDDRLRLIFTCCHPSLAPQSQVELALRLLCGLSTAEVARAFLTAEPTMAKRLVRTKHKIKAANIPYRIPDEHELPDRLQTVLVAIYLTYTTGQGRPEAETDLCSESIRLGRMLRLLMPDEPEVAGLLALMLLTESRRGTRTDEFGALVLLRDQNRAGWNRALIGEGHNGA